MRKINLKPFFDANKIPLITLGAVALVLILPTVIWANSFWKFHLLVAETALGLGILLYISFAPKSSDGKDRWWSNVDTVKNFFETSNNLMTLLQTLLLFSLGIILYLNGFFGRLLEDNAKREITIEGVVMDYEDHSLKLDSVEVSVEAGGEVIGSMVTDSTGKILMNPEIKGYVDEVTILYKRRGYNNTWKKDGAGDKIKADALLKH